MEKAGESEIQKRLQRARRTWTPATLPATSLQCSPNNGGPPPSVLTENKRVTHLLSGDWLGCVQAGCRVSQNEPFCGVSFSNEGAHIHRRWSLELMW